MGVGCHRRSRNGGPRVIENANEGVANIRFFGSLRSFVKERGLPERIEEGLPPEGKSGRELATAMGLPTDRIEAVFRNGVIQRLDDTVYPGDRVAFVPPGTPGPYRVLLGMVGGGEEETPE